MKKAEEMRRLTDERNNTALAQEREVYHRRIKEAAESGQYSLTGYEPISESLVRELIEDGFEVTAERSVWRNEESWNVHITWVPAEAGSR